MVKRVGESRRMVVGWGRGKDKRRCFFITHKDLPETQGNPICCDPEDLQERMMDVADRVDRKRGKKE